MRRKHAHESKHKRAVLPERRKLLCPPDHIMPGEDSQSASSGMIAARLQRIYRRRPLTVTPCVQTFLSLKSIKFSLSFVNNLKKFNISETFTSPAAHTSGCDDVHTRIQPFVTLTPPARPRGRTSSQNVTGSIHGRPCPVTFICIQTQKQRIMHTFQARIG